MNPFNNSNTNNANADPNVQINQLMNSPMFQALRNRGMSPEQMVRYICNQRGINVDSFIKQLNNNK